MKKTAGIVFSFLLRCIVVIMITLLVQNMLSLVRNLKNQKHYLPLRGYSAIYVMPSEGYDGQEDDELDKKLIAYFHESNSENSSWLFHMGNQLLLYNSGLIDEEELKVTDRVITINMGYLKACQLKDVDGNLIIVDENSGIDYLIVPEKYRENEEEIREYFIETNTFLRYFYDDMMKYGLVDAHEQQHPDIQLEIIYMENDMTFPTYFSHGQIGDKISNQIFMVVTSSNVSDVQIPAYVTSQTYLVKNEVVKNAIDKAGLENNILRVEDVYEEYIRNIYRNIIAVAIQLAISIFVEGIIYLIYKKMLHGEIKFVIISWLLTVATVIVVWRFLFLSFVKAFMLLIVVECVFTRKSWCFSSVQRLE